ncbi:MAG TPA: hypothetical protein P5234_15510 [Thermoanaerobaculaceae bacterium]|nr:hypothetical protein [Thermoanaerobaculaceae bacterium]HRS17643.1 hypothetical protein [Thermoanaerobaculaceae bacterium]
MRTPGQPEDRGGGGGGGAPHGEAARSAITSELLLAVFEQYRLPPFGLHGVPHWARVLENGRRLAPLTGARSDVVELFAVLHDACRRNEHCDPRHGARGAELASRLRGAAFDLDDAGLGLLIQACAGHTDGKREGDVTVLTCWDADRLDLARAGIRPHAERLCTVAARDPELIAWASARSLALELPARVAAEWGIDARFSLAW